MDYYGQEYFRCIFNISIRFRSKVTVRIGAVLVLVLRLWLEWEFDLDKFTATFVVWVGAILSVRDKAMLSASLGFMEETELCL